MNEIIAYVLTILSIIMLIISGVWVAIMLKNYITLQKQLLDLQEINKRLKDENKCSRTEYSDGLLKYLRMFTSQVTVLKFKAFIDGHHMDKITKSNVEKLINDIAKMVNESVNTKNIDFEDALFTKEFYENYIIETTIITVKDLLEKALIDVVD